MGFLDLFRKQPDPQKVIASTSPIDKAVSSASNRYPSVSNFVSRNLNNVYQGALQAKANAQRALATNALNTRTMLGINSTQRPLDTGIAGRQLSQPNLQNMNINDNFSKFFSGVAPIAKQYGQNLYDSAYNTLQSGSKLSPIYKQYRQATGNPVSFGENLGNITNTGLGALNTAWKLNPLAPVVGATFGGLKDIRQNKVLQEALTKNLTQKQKDEMVKSIFDSSIKGINEQPGFGSVFTDNPKTQQKLDTAFLVGSFVFPHAQKKLNQSFKNADEISTVSKTLNIKPTASMDEVSRAWKIKTKDLANKYGGIENIPLNEKVALNNAKDILSKTGVFTKIISSFKKSKQNPDSVISGYLPEKVGLFPKQEVKPLENILRTTPKQSNIEVKQAQDRLNQRKLEVGIKQEPSSLNDILSKKKIEINKNIDVNTGQAKLISERFGVDEKFVLDKLNQGYKPQKIYEAFSNAKQSPTEIKNIKGWVSSYLNDFKKKSVITIEKPEEGKIEYTPRKTGEYPMKSEATDKELREGTYYPDQESKDMGVLESEINPKMKAEEMERTKVELKMFDELNKLQNNVEQLVGKDNLEKGLEEFNNKWSNPDEPEGNYYKEKRDVLNKIIEDAKNPKLDNVLKSKSVSNTQIEQPPIPESESPNSKPIEEVLKPKESVSKEDWVSDLFEDMKKKKETMGDFKSKKWKEKIQTAKTKEEVGETIKDLDIKIDELSKLMESKGSSWKKEVENLENGKVTELNKYIKEILETGRERAISEGVKVGFRQEYYPQKTKMGVEKWLGSEIKERTAGDVLVDIDFSKKRKGELKDWERTPESLKAYIRESLANAVTEKGQEAKIEMAKKTKELVVKGKKVGTFTEVKKINDTPSVKYEDDYEGQFTRTKDNLLRSVDERVARVKDKKFYDDFLDPFLKAKVKAGEYWDKLSKNKSLNNEERFYRWLDVKKFEQKIAVDTFFENIEKADMKQGHLRDLIDDIAEQHIYRDIYEINKAKDLMGFVRANTGRGALYFNITSSLNNIFEIPRFLSIVEGKASLNATKRLLSGEDLTKKFGVDKMDTGLTERTRAGELMKKLDKAGFFLFDQSEKLKDNFALLCLDEQAKIKGLTGDDARKFIQKKFTQYAIKYGKGQDIGLYGNDYVKTLAQFGQYKIKDLVILADKLPSLKKGGDAGDRSYLIKYAVLSALKMMLFKLAIDQTGFGNSTGTPIDFLNDIVSKGGVTLQ